MKDISKFNVKDNNCVLICDGSLDDAMLNISELMAYGYMTLDYYDFETMLRGCRYAVITSAEGEGANRLSEAINKICNSPVWNEHELKSANKLIIKIMGSKESVNPITVGEMDELSKFLSKLLSNIEVKWGIGDDPSLGDKVKIILVAAGFDEM